MSSRAIRRLRQEQLASSQLSDVDDESESDEEQVQTTAAFLHLDDDDSSDDDSCESDTDDDEKEEEEDRREQTTLRNVKVSNHKVSDKPKQTEEEEDIDAILSSFQNDTSLAEESASSPDDIAVSTTLRCVLLSPLKGYDVSALDLDNAIKNLLGGGAAVVGELNEAQQPRGGRRQGRGNVGRRNLKKYLFGRPRESWGKPPSYVGGGLGCKELTQQVLNEERNTWSIPWPYNQQTETDESNNSNQKWYTLTMSDTYREQQHAYHQLLRRSHTSSRHSAAALEDPNTLAMFVADHPNYAETLLQLSMVLYHVNDRGRGADLLRRCMYVFECALPSAVLPNNTIGTKDDPTTNNGEYEILMDIDRQPNQGLFATLFRIMQTSGMAGCYPNAFMTGRYLLSLDPLRDPMGVLLILDYYALAYGQNVELLEGKDEMGASFVKELVECELVKIHCKDLFTDRHWVCELKDMPGWAFSYALALYRLGHNDDCEDEEIQEKADEALVNALNKFPMVLPKLLAMNKVNTQDRSFIVDWPKVLPYFTVETDDATEGSMQDRVAKGAGVHLVRIFVQRNHKLWAADNVVQWMYKCADMVVEKITKVTDNDEKEATDEAAQAEGNQTSKPDQPHLASQFHPALTRYAKFNPSEYEDAFQTLPPEAIALDPNIIAPAMEFNPNRRGRFLRRGQVPEEMIEGGQEGLLARLREALGVGNEMNAEVLDPDSPLLQLYLQSLLPWNQVDGVRPPR